MSPKLDNPILNSPFRMPSRHWELSEKGMPTEQALSGRRPSAYIVPIPKATRTAGQLELDVEGPVNLKTNDLVNRIRDRVDQWRALPAGQWGVTMRPHVCSCTARDRSRAAAFPLSGGSVRDHHLADDQCRGSSNDTTTDRFTEDAALPPRFLSSGRGGPLEEGRRSTVGAE